MPPRPLLSSEQRTRLFAIPTDAPEMTRHYVLDADDRSIVGARRRAGNRLCFAVQPCALRHPGRGLDPSGVAAQFIIHSILGVARPCLFPDNSPIVELIW
jgi:hypothetical protein